MDFDGTVVTHDYPRIGQDIGAFPILRGLVANGHKLILYTMRSGESLDEAIALFYKNEIPLYAVNNNPEQKKWTDSIKVYAQLYIDDAALGIPLIFDPDMSKRPYVNWIQVRERLIVLGLIKGNSYSLDSLLGERST